MDKKRYLTAILGLPIIILIFLFGNEYVLGICFFVASIICMKEYFTVVKKVSKPIVEIGYLANFIIIAAMFIKDTYLLQLVSLLIPFIMLALFLKVIITNMRVTFKDVAYTLIGMAYIPLFYMFLELIRCMDCGKILIGYLFVVAWATDIFAYLIGKKFGKHFFSKISPKKTIEGCVAGIIGATVVSLIYILISNNFWGTEYSYLLIAIISIFISIISQIGDFIASSIKRFVDVKDYGNLLPGHGGLLDRTDSLLFIAPFVYIIFSII